jgi:hypothetical protein
VAGCTRAAAVHTIVWPNNILVLCGQKDRLCMVDSVGLNARRVNVALDVADLHYITVYIAADLHSNMEGQPCIGHQNSSLLLASLHYTFNNIFFTYAEP